MFADVLKPESRNDVAARKDWSQVEAYRSPLLAILSEDGNGTNLHAYVGADPVNQTDPGGRQEQEVFVTAHGLPVNDDASRIPSPSGFGNGATGTATGAIEVILERIACALDPGSCVVVEGRRPERNQRPSPRPFVSSLSGRLLCAGDAYVLAGNPATVGRTGGFLGPVRAGSAAVIPRQFTGSLAAGPVMRSIGSDAYGYTSGGQYFFGFTDTIGHAELGDAESAQDTIMARHPGQFVLELVTGHQEDNSRVVLSLAPQTPRCPDGTAPF